LHIARYLHDLLSKNVDWISETVFNKYKVSSFERASAVVTEFYLVGYGENALKFLEDLPDVNEGEQNKVEAAAPEPAERPQTEEKDVRSDDQAAISFADSGYGDELCGTTPSSPVKDATSKDAPVAGDVRSLPTPSSKSSSTSPEITQ
jgi:hypothetical protein